MADLSINFAGIRSPNPFWLASAPPSNSGEQVHRAFGIRLRCLDQQFRNAGCLAAMPLDLGFSRRCLWRRDLGSCFLNHVGSHTKKTELLKGERAKPAQKFGKEAPLTRSREKRVEAISGRGYRAMRAITSGALIRGSPEPSIYSEAP